MPDTLPSKLINDLFAQAELPNNPFQTSVRKYFKLLLNPGAHAADLNSVATVLKALEGDPDKEGKLAQARQDAAKGIISLPEDTQPGTAHWFRTITDKL